MTDDQLTNAAAAALLGVTPATLKRWANSGRLVSQRTVGGHRRFSRVDVLALRARLAGAPTVVPPPQHVALLGQCLQAPGAQALAGHLLQLHGHHREWRTVVSLAERAFEEALHRRARGLINGVEERLATEKLSRAAVLLAQAAPLPQRARPVLLLAAEGERHLLPLVLAELLLNVHAVPTLFTGGNTPLPAVTRALRTLQPAAVVVLATPGHPRPVSLPDQAALLANAARVHGVNLVLLGGGAWPNRPDATRVRAAAQLLEVLPRDLVGWPVAPPGA